MLLEKVFEYNGVLEKTENSVVFKGRLYVVAIVLYIIA